MVYIDCINPNCTAPGKKFEWDEKLRLEAGGRLAKEGDPEAKSFIARCTYCGTRNKIWLVKVDPNVPVTRGP